MEFGERARRNIVRVAGGVLAVALSAATPGCADDKPVERPTPPSGPTVPETSAPPSPEASDTQAMQDYLRSPERRQVLQDTLHEYAERALAVCAQEPAQCELVDISNQGKDPQPGQAEMRIALNGYSIDVIGFIDGEGGIKDVSRVHIRAGGDQGPFRQGDIVEAEVNVSEDSLSTTTIFATERGDIRLSNNAYAFGSGDARLNRYSLDVISHGIIDDPQKPAQTIVEAQRIDSDTTSGLETLFSQAGV